MLQIKTKTIEIYGIDMVEKARLLEEAKEGGVSLNLWINDLYAID